MRVAVVHNQVDEQECDPSVTDVLTQARHVETALAEAGHTCRCLPFGDDVAALLADARGFAADRVFNLVEAVRGSACAHPAAAALWELAGLPHTGSPSLALALTTDKPLAKTLLRAAGIPTPPWTVCRGDAGALDPADGPWIIKPACEDASAGIDEDSVRRDLDGLRTGIEALARRFPGQAILVERFVEGREFNVSVLAGPNGPMALPPAEIVFDSYPEGKERVVGYRAKWDDASFEYQHTIRRFEFAPEDAEMLERLRRTALGCWELFGLAGYARVDMRVDESSAVWVVEVNTNPCLSPDAGFAAAVDRAGISPARMVEQILEDVV